MARLAGALEAEYGTPELGNQPDPLDEAVYILITYQTDLERAQSVWAELKRRFPTWADVLGAPMQELEHVLRPSGFHRARARLIRRMLLAVQGRWGMLRLRGLEDLDCEAAEAELKALPGLGIK